MVHVATSLASQPTEQEKLGGRNEIRLMKPGRRMRAEASVRSTGPVFVAVSVYVTGSLGPVAF